MSWKVCCCKPQSTCENLNSLTPSDTKGWNRTWSTLVEVMACCLTAPSHYLNQCWLIISEVLLHSQESNFPGNTHDIYLSDVLENFICKIAATYPRGQWVKETLGHFHRRHHSGIDRDSDIIFICCVCANPIITDIIAYSLRIGTVLRFIIM